MKIKTKQYALAFYETAKEHKIFSECLSGLTLVKDNSSFFIKNLTQPKSSMNEKKDFLLSQNIDKYLTNFLILLVRNNDLSKIKNILEELKKLHNKDNDIIEAQVTLQYEPDDQEKKDIESKLTFLTKKKIMVNYNTNSEILGGIIIKIGDRLIDNSLKNQLEILQKELSA